LLTAARVDASFSSMQRVLNILRLIRFVNCLMAAAGVWIGAFLTWLMPDYRAAILPSLAAFFVCAAGNALNDILDLRIDRVNRPQRVLACCKLTVRAAWITSALATSLALVSALFANTAVMTAVFAALLMLAAYNYVLKRVPVVGNVVVAALTGLTFYTGGLAVDPRLALVLPGPLVPAVFALLFHLVRELIKDVQDLEGDSRAGVRTLPQIIGVSRTLIVALAVFFLLVIATYVPVVTGWFGKAYRIIAIYCMDLPLLALLAILWGNPSPVMLRITSAALKVGMVLGLIALVLG